MRTIRMTLDQASIDEAIAELEKLRDSLQDKANAICERLTEEGYTVAYSILAEHVYSGETLGSLQVHKVGPARYEISAASSALLFLEFGAGIKGVGHPKAGDWGMGAGTYPGQTHAFDPGGWWFETDDPSLAVYMSKKGKMYGHSYGNPPYMPMYHASVEMRNKILEIAREVFQT